MKIHSAPIKRALCIAVLSAFAASIHAQESIKGEAANETAQVANSSFDANYEDGGARIYISKIYPKFELYKNRLVAGHGFFEHSVLISGDIPTHEHQLFRSVANDTGELIVRPIVVGTRAGIANLEARKNTNSVFGALGAVAMFALTKGASSGSGAASNLSALRDVSGAGLLKSSNFKDSHDDSKNSQFIEAKETDYIYVAGVKFQQTQKDIVKDESLIYIVIPNEMKSEVLTGKSLYEYNYGSNFKQILMRAILKTANIATTKLTE